MTISPISSITNSITIGRCCISFVAVVMSGQHNAAQSGEYFRLYWAVLDQFAVDCHVATALRGVRLYAERADCVEFHRLTNNLLVQMRAITQPQQKLEHLWPGDIRLDYDQPYRAIVQFGVRHEEAVLAEVTAR